MGDENTQELQYTPEDEELFKTLPQEALIVFAEYDEEIEKLKSGLTQAYNLINEYEEEKNTLKRTMEQLSVENQRLRHHIDGHSDIKGVVRSTDSLPSNLASAITTIGRQSSLFQAVRRSRTKNPSFCYRYSGRQANDSNEGNIDEWQAVLIPSTDHIHSLLSQGNKVIKESEEKINYNYTMESLNIDPKKIDTGSCNSNQVIEMLEKEIYYYRTINKGIKNKYRDILLRNDRLTKALRHEREKSKVTKINISNATSRHHRPPTTVRS